MISRDDVFPAQEGVAKGSIFLFSTSEALMGRGQENSKDPLATPSQAGIQTLAGS
jgi:hypothetical protein